MTATAPAPLVAQDADEIAQREAQIEAQMRDMGNLLGSEAMFPTGTRHAGRLAPGASTRVLLSLDADREWQIVGVCDGACPNLDLVLRSREGEELADDRLPDDIPLPEFERLLESGDDGTLALRFNRRKNTSIHVIVEVSTDLQSWTPLTLMEGNPVDQGDGTALVTMVGVPTTVEAEQYFRLRVEKR